MTMCTHHMLHEEKALADCYILCLSQVWTFAYVIYVLFGVALKAQPIAIC